MGTEYGLDILVVDRDEGSNIDTKALLSEAGHRPHVLTDPEQVVSELARGSFQLVLLDLSLPGGFAAELLQQIRGVDADLRVVAMTAVAALDGAAGPLAGETFDFVLQKPVDRAELDALLEDLTGEKGLEFDRRGRLDDVRTLERRLRARRPAPRTTAKQALYNAISRLPRGRGLVEHWVRRIPGLDLPDRQVEVCTLFGTRMLINPSDNSLERSVYVRGIYEVPLTSFLLSVLPRVKVFWDVGAHVGYHTLLGSHTIGPGGRVVAFEPHPRVFSLIEENVQSFGYGNVTLLNMGLSNEDSEQEIFDEGDNVTRAPTFVSGIYSHSGHRCRLVSGDGLLASSRMNGARLDTPDLIKIDIEGYESNALEGMTKLLSSTSPPILVFELNDKFNPDQAGVLELISSCNPYEFHVENPECRYPTRRSDTDGPVPGFVPLRIDDIPSQCNVLAYCADVHTPLIAEAAPFALRSC